MEISIQKTKCVKSLTLERFRGFYEKQKIDFAIPNGKRGSGLTVIVGQNNSGKSSIINALLRFSNVGAPKNFSKQERHGKDLNTSLIFTDGEDKTKEILGNSIGLKVLVSSKYEESKSFEFLDPRKKWLGRLKRKGYVPGKGMEVEGYVNTSIVDSEAVLLEARHHNFLDPLIGIFENKALKTKFDSAVRLFFEDFNDWFIELDGDEYIFEYKTNKNESHQVELFGDGIISLFKFVAHLISKTSERIMVIDEPELFLHPQAQKKLAKQFSYISENRQVILSTHSPYFVNWDDVRNGCKIVRTFKRDDKCKIKQIESDPILLEKLLNLSNDWQKPQLLDTVAKELFFTDAVVFVEGQEDVGLIIKFIKEKELNTNFDIFGYGVGGSGNIEAFLEMSINLGIKSGALFDKSKSSDAEKCRKRFENSALIQVHSKFDIRDKFNLSEEIEGIFNANGEMKTENEIEMNCLINNFCEYFLNKV